MAVILSRDTTLYLSTVDIDIDPPTAANTTKLRLLDGYKMTQKNVVNAYSSFRNSVTPSRVETKYVKDLDLVDLQFTTYCKTQQNAGLSESADKILWDSLTNNGTSTFSDRMEIDFLSSSTNIFPNLYIYLQMDNDTFKVGKCYIESVTFDFDIDGILATNWKIKALDYSIISNAPSTFLDRTELDGYLKTKLSVLEFNRQSTDYHLPIIGGSFTIQNKVIKLSTPIVSQQLAVNRRVVIEDRSCSGSISVYLRTGKNRSKELLESMLNSISTINDLSNLTINLGNSAGRRVALLLPTTIISLPEINVNDIVSTDIELLPVETALGANDDIKIIYYN